MSRQKYIETILSVEGDVDYPSPFEYSDVSVLFVTLNDSNVDPEDVMLLVGGTIFNHFGSFIPPQNWSYFGGEDYFTLGMVEE